MQSQRVRQRLAHHVRELERLVEEKTEASAALAEAFAAAKTEGYDTTTLKVVLKLRKMTSSQRRERRALEAIYMAALGILDGDPLPDEARRRLSGEEDQKPSPPKEPDVALVRDEDNAVDRAIWFLTHRLTDAAKAGCHHCDENEKGEPCFWCGLKTLRSSR